MRCKFLNCPGMLSAARSTAFKFSETDQVILSHMRQAAEELHPQARNHAARNLSDAGRSIFTPANVKFLALVAALLISAQERFRKTGCKCTTCRVPVDEGRLSPFSPFRHSRRLQHAHEFLLQPSVSAEQGVKFLVWFRLLAETRRVGSTATMEQWNVSRYVDGYCIWEKLLLGPEAAVSY